jgi:hypothetical protein
MHKKDVTINAPIALGNNSAEKEIQKAIKSILPDIDYKDYIDLQKLKLRELEDELEKTRLGANAIANACLCLYKMLLDLGYSDDGETIIFHRDLVNKMKGGQIAIGEDVDGNRTFKITNRFNYHVKETELS